MKYLSATEAALEWRVSAAWVRKQCKAKVILATKVGREWRIAPADLESAMRKYRGSAMPAAQPRHSTVKRHTQRVAS